MLPFSLRNDHNFARDRVSDLGARRKTAGIQNTSIIRIPNPALFARDSGGVFGFLCFWRTGRLGFLRCGTFIRAGIGRIGGAKRREYGGEEDRGCFFHGV